MSILSGFVANFRRATHARSYAEHILQSEEFSLHRQKRLHEVYSSGRLIASIPDCIQRKNTCSGDCLVVGAGPSLKEADVRLLKTLDTFALNGSIKYMLKTGIMPTHYVISDKDAVILNFSQLEVALSRHAHCYLTPKSLYNLYKLNPTLLSSETLSLIEAIDRKYDRARPTQRRFYQQYKAHEGIHILEKYKHRRGTIGFNFCQDVGFFTSRTVSIWALQLACYLGYRRIFLIGMDMGATGNSHAYAEENGIRRNSGRKAALKQHFSTDHFSPDIEECFRLARQAATVHGFQIINLTPVSRISENLIPRMTVTEAFPDLCAASL